MDAPEVARRTGARLLGSESTANIGRGWGLPESQIRVVVNRQPIRLGRFLLTPIESRHFQFPDPRMAERALARRRWCLRSEPSSTGWARPTRSTSAIRRGAG